jgi:hypothetical protein
MATPDPHERLAALIAQSARAKFGRGVSEEVIADAERHLGMSFPPSYRWWLMNYGGGYLGSCELQGLFLEMIDSSEPDLPLIGDLVYLADLNAMRPAHPKHLLEILSYEGDEVYFLDTARPNANGEYPVIGRYPSVDELQDVAIDFAAFLERELPA